MFLKIICFEAGVNITLLNYMPSVNEIISQTVPVLNVSKVHISIQYAAGIQGKKDNLLVSLLLPSSSFPFLPPGARGCQSRLRGGGEQGVTVTRPWHACRS